MRSFSRSYAALAFLAACAPAQEAQAPLPAAPVLVTEAAAPALKPPAPVDLVNPTFAVPSAPPGFVADKLERTDFNRIAAEMALPYFWVRDANENKTLDPSEFTMFRGPAPAAVAVANGSFTSVFADNYVRMLEWHDHKGCAGTGPDAARRSKVCADLAQGRQTLVQNDFSKTELERKLAGHMLVVADLIEKLYGAQMGLSKVPAPSDSPSQMMLFRNQSPKCAFPKSTGVKGCHVGSDTSSGLYPAGATEKKDFCKSVAESKDESVKSPFTVVSADAAGGLKGVPYTQVYGDTMKAVSVELKAAEKDLGEAEPALRAYLAAAAQSFLDNNWVPADEAWAKMGVDNSSYYLRVGPDEVYAEPCSVKALFHLGFSRINPGSKEWQAKLGPMKDEMESVIAELAGAPYTPRNVSFKLPDFIDVVLNAGDSRPPFGATIGQSLPNFGPVANEGRGRTVAMTNFYNDPDSLAASKKTAESLLCQSVMPLYTQAPEPKLMSTVLHEAAHNLGPAHQYKVEGKDDRAAFGGPLASTLEEFKAQSAALFYTDWLVGKGALPQRTADQAHVQDLLWNFGHISRGMYDEAKHPRNYSQLSAMQLGLLMKSGAVSWMPKEKAANGADVGCFSVTPSAYPKATRELLKVAAGLKARGDKKGAMALVKAYVDAPDATQKAARKAITERVGRVQTASFVYSIKVD